MKMQQEQHDMTLEKTHDSGAEEWACLTCGRKMLIRWAPAFKRIVLEEGNNNVIHNGSKGGLKISQTSLSKPESQIMSNELRNLIDDALKNVDFGD